MIYVLLFVESETEKILDFWKQPENMLSTQVSETAQFWEFQNGGFWNQQQILDTY